MLKNFMANKCYVAIAFLVACVCLYILYTKWWRKPDESNTSVDENEDATQETIDDDDEEEEEEEEDDDEDDTGETDGKVTEIKGLEGVGTTGLSTV